MAYRTYATTNGFIVSPDGTGDFKTITAAMAAALIIPGVTIFLRDAIYTENFTMAPDTNLVSFNAANYRATGLIPTVTIQGKVTCNYSGTSSISGIRFQTNGDFAIQFPSANTNATVLNLSNVYLEGTNNTIIDFSSNNGSAKLNTFFSIGNISAGSGTLFTGSSTGGILFEHFDCQNAALSATPSSLSAGGFTSFWSTFDLPFSFSGSNVSSFNFSRISPQTNTTGLAIAGSGQLFNCSHSNISGNAQPAISIGLGTLLTLNTCVIGSSNTNAITGGGALNYATLSFNGISSNINVTTQSGGTIQGGVFQAPSVGFLGEQIRSGVTGVSLTTTTPANITSITLSAGIWDICAVGMINDSGLSLTAGVIGISTNTGSYTGTVSGDSKVLINSNALLANAIGLSIPGFRVTITTSTTYYLVGQGNGAGTITADGRISGTRVG